MAVILILALMVMNSLTPVLATKEMKDWFLHTGTCGTQNGKEENDPDFYSTNSKIPHLPFASGHMGTHGTYRFLTVQEQVATLIGDGKHGMWRLQNAGYIRLYRTKGEEGIGKDDKEDALDGEDDTLNKILADIYYPIDGNNRDHEHSFGEELSDKEQYNWLDLPIHHPRFEGKYADHPAIDLPWYYCGLSGADYPHVGNIWKYIKAQKKANKVGPLGIRAGLDVNENVNNILRMEMFGGGGIYANIGQGEETDGMPLNREDMKKSQTINYQRVDDSKVDSEFYLLESGYHNYPESYLIIGMVMNIKDSNSYSYIRPDGRYYEGLKKRGLQVDKYAETNSLPPVWIKDIDYLKDIYGTASFGQNHPNRKAHGLTGGACPTKGGDVSTYPWGNPGSGWPTDYEEVTPICDGIVVDIKYWADLDKSWDDEKIALGNSGFGTEEVEYFAMANHYGEFTDPWNIKQGNTNPQELDLTEDGKIVMEAPEKIEDHPVVSFKMDFGKIGEAIDFVEVELDPLPRGCAAQKAKDDGEYNNYVSSAERIKTAFGSFFLLIVYYCA